MCRLKRSLVTMDMKKRLTLELRNRKAAEVSVVYVGGGMRWMSVRGTADEKRVMAGT